MTLRRKSTLAFARKHLAGVPTIQDALDLPIAPDILDTIDRWVEKEVRPIARKFDQADEYPADLVEQMK